MSETSYAHPEPDQAPTGIDAVDAVVESLGQLDALPVAEHVAVFERAHESLRATLSDAALGEAARGAVRDDPAARA